jgi:hypothetical protein
MMGYLDLRLREITGINLPLGGMNCIILGDDSQLSCMEKPLYDKTKSLKERKYVLDQVNSSDICNLGLDVYKNFKLVIFLDQVMRQNYSEPIFGTST